MSESYNLEITNVINRLVTIKHQNLLIPITCNFTCRIIINYKTNNFPIAEFYNNYNFIQISFLLSVLNSNLYTV